MSSHLKYLISLLVIVSLITACSRSSRKQQQTATETQKKEEPESKDQYRIAENFTGSKAQIIDLIQGTADFKIEFEGDSTCVMRLLNPDGSLVDVLADVRGNYRGKKTINVPRTGSYILDVKTTGRWSVYRQ
jgi:hypothetical protein